MCLILKKKDEPIIYKGKEIYPFKVVDKYGFKGDFLTTGISSDNFGTLKIWDNLDDFENNFLSELEGMQLDQSEIRREYEEMQARKEEKALRESQAKQDSIIKYHLKGKPPHVEHIEYIIKIMETKKDTTGLLKLKNHLKYLYETGFEVDTALLNYSPKTKDTFNQINQTNLLTSPENELIKSG